MKELIIALILILILTLCRASMSASTELVNDFKKSNAYEEALQFEADMERGNRLYNLQKKVDRASDNLIKATVGELKKRGHEALAYSIEMDWNSRYKGFVYSFKGARDVGDHAALIWLLKIHDDIHSVLGDKICRAIRTHDLWVIAMTVGVVFGCQDSVDSEEYKKHFIPLSGIASYWVSYGVCVGATFGTGIVFLCGLGGMIVEELVVRFIAPPLSQPCWKLACRN